VDQKEAGSPIANLSGFAGLAEVSSGSYVGLTAGDVEASATSNNNLNAKFTFVLNQDTGITFDFDVDAWLQVALTSDELFPGFATASYGMSFSIVNLTDGGNVYTFNPDLFGTGEKTLSLNAPLPIDVELTRDATAKHFSSTTVKLFAGKTYQLSARINTDADAERVPEPGVLALVGLGLLGMGVSRRRKAA
jgi:hypothetical protein